MIILQKIGFIVELLIADGLLCYHFKRRQYFILRLLASLIAIFFIGIFLPIINNAFYNFFRYFFFLLLTIGGMFFCFKEKLIKDVFVSLIAYTLQHIAYLFFDLFAIITGIYNVHNVIGSGAYDFFLIFTSNGNSFVSGNPFTIMMYLFIYYITYFVSFLFIHKRLEKKIQLGINNIKMLALAGLIIVFDIIVSSFISYYSHNDFNRVYLGLLDVFNIFCCVLSLVLLFLEDNRGQMASDLTIVKHLLKERQEQYEISKSNIDLINQKCHDLKHQIRAIGKNQYVDEKVISEIEKTISIYDANVKTSNEPLDIILTEKNLFCNKHQIKLCCIIDGAQLSFMSEPDLYSLFGNLIDNAIEAVEKLSDDKKIISLSVKKNKSFLVINIYNYYDGVIEFSDKLPKTTKADSKYHGYGMKSIQMIVDKYHGEFSLTTDKNVFNVNIIFPLTA